LTRRGLLYIHEYKNKVDFVTISPKTGEVTIIECKVSMDAAGKVSSAIWQLNEYHDFMGISDAKRLCITLTPIRDFQRVEFEMNNVPCLIFGLSMPKMECLPSRKTVPAFNEVFQRFNEGKTMDEVRAEYNQLGREMVPTLRLSNDEITRYNNAEWARIEARNRQLQELLA
jgi:hypothetical protein